MGLTSEDKAFIASALDDVRQATVNVYSVTISNIDVVDRVDDEFDIGNGGGSAHTRKVTVPDSPTYSNVPVNIIDVNSLMLATSPRFTPYLETLNEEGEAKDIAFVMWLSQDYSVKEEDVIEYKSETYRITRLIPDEIDVQNVAFLR